MLKREIEQSASSREARDTLGIGCKGSQESMEEGGRGEGIPVERDGLGPWGGFERKFLQATALKPDLNAGPINQILPKSG